MAVFRHSFVQHTTYIVTIIIFVMNILTNHGRDNPILSHLLTPQTATNNAMPTGIELTTNEVTNTVNNEWNVSIASQTNFQFALSLNKTWGFHSDRKSSIKITIDSPSTATGPDTFDDIVFGFSIQNSEFFSVWIPMDNNGQKNRIYPNCDTSSPPTQRLAAGDITGLLNNDRNCDIAGGSCSNWHTIRPKNAQYPNIYEYNGFPLTFTLENDPISDTFYVKFDSASFSKLFAQKCGFVGVPTSQGLQVFIGGNDIGQQFIISSILVESFADAANTATDPEPATTDATEYDAENRDNVNRVEAILETHDDNGHDVTFVIALIAGLFVFAVCATTVYIQREISQSKILDEMFESQHAADEADDFVPEAGEGVVTAEDDVEAMGNAGNAKWYNTNSAQSPKRKAQRKLNVMSNITEELPLQIADGCHEYLR